MYSEVKQQESENPLTQFELDFDREISLQK